MKAATLILLIIASISSTILYAQGNHDHIDAIHKQLASYPGQTLGYGAQKIYHIYEIKIAEDATITENANSYIIDKVEITMALSTTAYDITKEKINYKFTVFKEFKGSYAMGRKDLNSVQVIWSKKESTKEFQEELKKLKNFADNTFDELYGPEDDYPEDWKITQ